MTRLAAWLFVIAVGVSAADLEAIKAEPNLEKRSKAALAYADDAVTEARKAYTSGEYKQAFARVEEVRAAVELSLESLNETGKIARRKPKPFKHAEMRIRALLRRLRSLEHDFALDDRPLLVKTEQRLQEIHDELLARIMAKKKN
jgi:hypothetical protein